MPIANRPKLEGVSFKMFAPGKGARPGEYNAGNFTLTHGSDFRLQT